MFQLHIIVCFYCFCTKDLRSIQRWRTIAPPCPLSIHHLHQRILGRWKVSHFSQHIFDDLQFSQGQSWKIVPSLSFVNLFQRSCSWSCEIEAVKMFQFPILSPFLNSAMGQRISLKAKSIQTILDIFLKIPKIFENLRFLKLIKSITNLWNPRDNPKNLWKNKKTFGKNPLTNSYSEKMFWNPLKMSIIVWIL